MSQFIFRTAVLIVLFLLAGSSVNVSAQKKAWHYLQTIYGGVKVYLNDEVQILLRSKHRVVWDKRLNADNSFAVSKVEWDCLNKRSLILEMTMYDTDRISIGTTRNFEWQSVIPGTVAETAFQTICVAKPPAQFVEIISLQANLRSFPDAGAVVLGVAKQGSRFRVTPYGGQGGWYNIVDTKTEQDYWVHGSTIKIIEPTAAKTPGATSSKVKKKSKK